MLKQFSPLHEVNRFFEDVIEHFPKRFGFDLALDLYQDSNNLIAEMSVPGIDINNTDISVVDDVLRISGTREEKLENAEKNYYSREIHRGSFERSIKLPSSVSAENTTASYKDGVLKVVMPFKDKAQSKKITISQE